MGGGLRASSLLRCDKIHRSLTLNTITYIFTIPFFFPSPPPPIPRPPPPHLAPSLLPPPILLLWRTDGEQSVRSVYRLLIHAHHGPEKKKVSSGGGGGAGGAGGAGGDWTRRSIVYSISRFHGNRPEQGQRGCRAYLWLTGASGTQGGGGVREGVGGNKKSTTTTTSLTPV